MEQGEEYYDSKHSTARAQAKQLLEKEPVEGDLSFHPKALWQMDYAARNPFHGHQHSL